MSAFVTYSVTILGRTGKERGEFPVRAMAPPTEREALQLAKKADPFARGVRVVRSPAARIGSRQPLRNPKFRYL